jgi:hypothetical protein
MKNKIIWIGPIVNSDYINKIEAIINKYYTYMISVHIDIFYSMDWKNSKYIIV